MASLTFHRLDRELAERSLPLLHELAADQAWMDWTDENYLYELPEKWSLSRLIREGPENVGYALCSRKGDGLWLHRLVVGPEHRGRGIGERVVAELIRIARAEGLTSVGCKTPGDNEGNRRFYTRLGFRETGTENDYVRFTRDVPAPGPTVGVHQPNYLPWLGYFYKISRSDVFVLLDDAEASNSRSYVNRTAVLIQGKSSWLTVPMDRSEQVINRIRQAERKWSRKHITSLECSYKKAPFFHEYFDGIAETLTRHSGGTLCEVNIELIRLVSSWLGLPARMLASSELGIDATRDDRLIEIVKRVGGSRYLSGKGGSNYQDPEKFRAAGIDLAYTGFSPVPYPQHGAAKQGAVQQGEDGFVPGLSVVDALFNIGAEGIREMFTQQGGPVPDVKPMPANDRANAT